MNAKGKPRGDGAQLARYLLTGEEGEIAELVSTRGLGGFADPEAAFAAFERIAELNTRSTKPFFHGHIRNAPGEHLTDAQWERALERMEKRLGYEGHPRIVSFHTDLETGEKHLHVAWFRIDRDTMRAIDPGLYKNNLKHMCRSLEVEFCLQEVSNFRKPDDRARASSQNEFEESRRLGTEVRAIRNTILDCLQRTDGGKAFKAALDERGLMLANGDKRDCFVVVDQAGGHHALNKKLTGMTLAVMRDRLGDIDRKELPSVEQAQAQQREKYPTPEQVQQQGRNTPQPHPEPARSQPTQRDDRPEAKHPAYVQEPAAATPTQQPELAQQAPRSKAAAEIHATWNQSPNAAAFVSAMHDQGYRMARVTPAEARDSERVAAFAKELGNRAVRYREGEIVAVNDRGWTYRLNEHSTGASRPDIHKFTAEMKDTVLPGMGEAKMAQVAEANKVQQTEPWHGRPVQKTEQTISRIQETADRGGMSVSAGLQAEGFTLARVDSAGRASVERENRRQYENAKREGKTDARLRQAPKEGELVAVNRYGDVFRLNPRFVETDRLERDATGGRDKTPTLSMAQQYFATERKPTKEPDHRPEVAQPFVGKPRDEKGGLQVNMGRVAVSLSSFVEGLFGMGPSPSSPDQQQAAPQGGRGEAAHDAMESIAESIKRGEALIPADIRNLTPETLMNIREHGDNDVHRMIRDMEIEKEQDIAQEWAEYDHERMGRER